MALFNSTKSGSTWLNFILKTMQTSVVPTLKGLPIKMETRAVPTHLSKLQAEGKDGVLLETFDSIPLYTLGSATQNKLKCTYPNGVTTDVSCTQE